MFVHEMGTPNPRVRLVKPDVARDAALGVEWLNGEEGRKTLRLMGVPDARNQASTFEKERERVQDFLDRTDQRNWMIELDDQIVGSVWIDLKPTPTMPAPSVHIMIGDPAARGQGAGSAAFRAALDWLRTNEALYPLVYSRHLAHNDPSGALLTKNNFIDLGEPYKDQDGLEWQNAYLAQKRIVQYVAVKAVIIQEGKALVLRQNVDDNVAGSGKCHPPGGIVEPGEALRNAVQREVKEETNLDVEVRELLGVDEWLAPIRGDQCQFCGVFFACVVASDSAKLRIDPEETSEAVWIDLQNMDDIEILEPSRSIIRRALQAAVAQTQADSVPEK